MGNKPNTERNIHTYEVRVVVKQNGSRHYSSHIGMYIENTVTKMFHKDARTGDQAMQKCEKYGRPIGYHKVDVEKMGFNVENMLLQEPYGADNPYPNAIAMDELIWRKKGKRNERIQNRQMDKSGY